SEAAAWDDAERIAAWLEQALDAYVGAVLGRTLPAVALQVEQLRLRLRSFARCQAAWVRKGWRTVGIECGTPEGGAPFDVDGAIVRLDRKSTRLNSSHVKSSYA